MYSLFAKVHLKPPEKYTRNSAEKGGVVGKIATSFSVYWQRCRIKVFVFLVFISFLRYSFVTYLTSIKDILRVHKHLSIRLNKIITSIRSPIFDMPRDISKTEERMEVLILIRLLSIPLHRKTILPIGVGVRRTNLRFK